MIFPHGARSAVHQSHGTPDAQPALLAAFACNRHVTMRSLDTNLPIWHGRVSGWRCCAPVPDGIDNRTLTREMVTPIVTDGAPTCCLPNWEQINPVLLEMFGE
jgi:hypothetical protein